MTHNQVNQVLHQGVSQLAEKATEELIENNLKPCIAATIIEDRDAFRSEVPDLIKRSLQDRANDPALWEVLKCKFEKSSTSNTSCRDDDIHSLHDDHQEDDAPPEGEKRVKRNKASKSLKSTRGYLSKHSAKDSITYVSNQQQQPQWDAWVEETVIDEDEATLNDALINQFKNAEEYDYHLEQTMNFIENQIVWESRQGDIRCPVPKPLVFFGPQWNPNEPPRITEVVRITIDQPHGLDFIEQIIMMRENDKLDSFSEADFKYLNKNNIEDLYYLFHNKKLGIESYQIKVNLTVPTLTFPGIAHEPYSIVDKPSTGLIYLNNKDEKRVMYLTEIVKFYDATLEKVLKERNKQATKSPRANEKMEIFCEWKTNSTDDEASVIINPQGEIIRFKKSVSYYMNWSLYNFD
ncbi:hypothetical protein Tco_1532810 [Tanacetum coccineum]